MEKNYSPIEREYIGLVFAIKKFEMYLYGKEFILLTDLRPLSYIQKCKVEHSRLMSMSLFLQNYLFRKETIKGSDNVGLLSQYVLKFVNWKISIKTMCEF